MFLRRTDIPLDRDAHARFLPWLIAFMVYLSILSIAGIMVLNKTIAQWDRGISGSLTVQILPLEGSAAVGASPQDRLLEVVGVLDNTPGVELVSPMAIEDTYALLEPWLGDVTEQADLPLPRLIDVTIDPDANIDLTALSKRLSEAVPGAILDDHRVWLDQLVNLLKTVQLLALGVVMVIAFVTMGTVIFTTRTGLALHSEAIQVLHLIGAQDSYVAKQFAGRALFLGLKGGLISFLFAVPTLVAIAYFAGLIEDAGVSSTGLDWYHYLAVSTIPLIVAIIAMLTARITVLRTLSRMV